MTEATKDQAQKVNVEQENEAVVAAEQLSEKIRESVRGSAGWVTVFGILEIIAGFGAVSYPLVFGEALTSVIGFLLIFAGVVQFLGLIRAGTGRVGVRFFIALFYLLIGIVLVSNPLSALNFLTLILGLFFLFEGMGKLLAGFEAQRYKGLFIVNGVATLILGLLIISGWPGESDWILGLLVGINLIISGITAISIGSSLKKA